MGRASMGVHGMRLDEGDEIIDMCPVNAGSEVLTITEGGFGKRTSPDEYREQGRNGKGIRAMNLTEKTGDMTALLLVNPDEDLLLITDDGTIIRTRVEDIRFCGRNTQGVTIMRVGDEDQVKSMAIVVNENEETATLAEK